MTDLNAQYDNQPIYTSAFYADPESPLQNRSTLLSTLKAFTKNESATTPFALQIMATNAELTIAPLGLLNLDELKTYTAKQRHTYGLNAPETTELPLVVQYEPHTENAKVSRQLVTTCEALFRDFNPAFEKIWQQVNADLAKNQQLLEHMVADLITDSQKIAPKFSTHLKALTVEKRKETLGFDLPDNQLAQFSRYLADNQEVKAIIASGAGFASHEIVGKQLFAQAMNDQILRNTFFWDLDNTFHEIFYYYLRKYGTNKVKLSKRLNHIKPRLLTKMRQTAWQQANNLTKQTKTPPQALEKLFTTVFVPVAEQLTAEIAKFNH
ncbi:hypothetical protein [Loigolactobacillus rennini]|uniref:Uncharacterized protein n=2 Tax=Loigolactobacillus rennini TaxID=238013 RepID=A0A0R2CVS8_9LACO|nr:hypothetical protein [Loigolactobacillus rennini]KRM95434.1 hypothetical protein FC24_GL002108 [Loigolactobacillus rennini DSM 20253]SFZ87009.1 unknown [Loigolactobacillus rennini]